MIDISHIPSELLEGENWPLLKPDNDWIWTVEHEDRTVGFLMAMGGHGIAMILRVRMLASAPKYCLLKLLRQFLKDARERGCTVYMGWMNIGRPEEYNLIKLTMKAGGYCLEMTHALCAGSIEEAEKY